MTTQEHHSSVWDAVIFRGRTTEILCCAVRALTWLSREVHMHAGPFLFTVLEQRARLTQNHAEDTPVCFVALYQQSPNHVICSSHLPVQQVLHAKCQGSALCVLRTGETDLTASEILIARAV